MLQKVSRFISSRPALIQIAKNDVWENTWDIHPEKLPNIDEINKYLTTDQTAKIGIEIVFSQPEGIYILGLVHNHHLLTPTSMSFLQAVLSEIQTYSDFSTFINNLDLKLVGERYLLQNPLDLIRLGIVNHWFSVGPLQVWGKGNSKTVNSGDITKLLISRPEIAASKLNYQGLSFIFNPREESPGLRHWIKSPCSNKVGDTWKVIPEKVIKYLESWQGFEITT